MNQVETKESKVNNNSTDFIKAVAKYFMDFLETDFHKRRAPKRSIKLHTEDNLLTGLNLSKYPSFYNLVWKLINNNFDSSILNKIEKGVYRTPIPENLISLIKLQVTNIKPKDVSNLVEKINDEVTKASTLYKDEYDTALTYSLENTSQIIKNEFVIPFVNNLIKPLENLKLGDENSIFLMEEELTSVLTNLVEVTISEGLKAMAVDVKVNLKQELKTAITVNDLKNNIVEFFQSFQVADLFSEIFEMERNKNILDKQEFYFYFCDITFNKAKYPIFYIPFSTLKEKDGISIEFDSQVYINKKALEYIVQEYHKDSGTKGSLKTITERIVYLTQHEGDFKTLIHDVLSELVNFFELDKQVDITSPAPQISKSLMVRISNSCYFALFDKSDEALVNDYENILKLLETNGILGDAFDKLIQDFIHNDPEPINPIVENEWDNTETSDRLVSISPIPLNSEQLQILSAIRKDGAKYLTVGGPPGTGKSHTITAIVFDAILKGQSVLVLSDKKEALDVVEDKITDTMNKVRHDKNFQNPILRLGKTGSTYGQILSASSIDNIKLHHKAVNNSYENLEQNIDKSSNSLKEDLQAEILSYQHINLEEIAELADLEKYYGNTKLIDIEEAVGQPNSPTDLVEFRRIFFKLSDFQNSNKVLNFLGISDSKINLRNFNEYVEFLKSILNVINNVHITFGKNIQVLSKLQDFTSSDLIELKRYLMDYRKLKSSFFGYLFKSKQLAIIDGEFRMSLPSINLLKPHESLALLSWVEQIFTYILNTKKGINVSYLENIDYLQLIFICLINPDFAQAVEYTLSLSDDLTYLYSNYDYYQKTFKKIGVGDISFKALCKNEFTDAEDLEFEKLIRLIALKQKISSDFSHVPEINYPDQQKDIQRLVTTQMTYIMDGRVINFYQNNRATATTLREIIKGKRKFPKEEFLKLKEAFPCILAGIRDYAEHIPLEPEIFDLVIIDEASQVSIAQAFPALLRAKKVLILGDKKQFSNIKAAQARSDTNREYLNELRDIFKSSVSNEPIKLVRLEKFDIKTSILDFFDFIVNYNSQLRKHFRGYKEIISYSNKYFYQGSLQVMKIRSKPIDEVIKFSFIEHDGKIEKNSNSNSLEVDFIISELQRLKNDGHKGSVGIITPHTDQQKLLNEKINQLPDRDYYFEKFNLKIMTFDTCQGEERDIIYYSMVANPVQDRLWGVFISDLNNVDIEEEGKIKAQRLNVGFSRSKECMHFVLSKPLDEFNGSIGDALRHYYNVLEEAKKEKDVSQVDANSEMEKQVLHWFYQTKFWAQNKERTEFIPQFEIGKYLKQLDPTYTHPLYKVDFLLTYLDETNKEHKIVIEYDGFKEHFTDLGSVNEFNFQEYYSNQDVYRQKVLESYGYRFLRINRFNVGVDPVQTLDERLSQLVKEGSNNQVLNRIHHTIEGLQNGDMKECPKCKEIRNLSDFKDSSLISGYGRFCRYCKDSHAIEVKARENQKAVEYAQGKLCPRCGSAMVLRGGRYGKFYGCSRYPYCKGTLK